MVAPIPDPSAARRVVAVYFAPGDVLAVERVLEGVSTVVYRITRGGERFYLRILPEIGASFAPEVYAHGALRASGCWFPR